MELHEIEILQGTIGEMNYPNDAGHDLYAELKEPVTLYPEPFKRTATISTGLAIQMPKGMFAMVVTRSSMSQETDEKPSILCHNGIIDGDFNGKIKVVLSLIGKRPYTINPGDRIAQIIFLPKLTVAFVTGRKQIQSSCKRGERGFGSTGK